jgi:glutamate synthase (ferredoxin)
MISDHEKYTGSKKAAKLLKNWEKSLAKFICVLPHDYRRMMQAINRAFSEGYTGEEALMIAFEANNRDLSRLSGN